MHGEGSELPLIGGFILGAVLVLGYGLGLATVAPHSQVERGRVQLDVARKMRRVFAVITVVVLIGCVAVMALLIDAAAPSEDRLSAFWIGAAAFLSALFLTASSCGRAAGLTHHLERQTKSAAL